MSFRADEKIENFVRRFFFEYFNIFFRAFKQFFSNIRWMFEKFVSNVRAILTTRLSIFSLMFQHIRLNVQTIFLNCSGIFSLIIKHFCSQLQTIFLKCLTIYVQKNFLQCFDRMLKKISSHVSTQFFPKVLAMFLKYNNIFPHMFEYYFSKEQ